MSDDTTRRTTTSDPFEETMGARGRVLHRDKKVYRSFAWIMLLSTVGFLAATIA